MLGNFIRGIWYQPLTEWYKTGNAFGILHKNSCVNRSNGKPKVAYPTEQVAKNAANSMQKKTGNGFNVYKCCFCDGYHIGKNL